MEFYRHSKKQGPGNVNLSSEGIQLAQHVGEHELRNKHYTHLCTSHMKRTQETLFAFAVGAGDFPKIKPEIFLANMSERQADDGLRLWNGVCHQAELLNEDMLQAALKNEHILAMKVAEEGSILFKQWVSFLPDKTRALIVHHSPFMELIVKGLFGRELPQLQPCEGFVIIEDDKGLHLERTKKSSIHHEPLPRK